jgi:hypothetical protein
MAKVMYGTKLYNMHISTIHKKTFISSQHMNSFTSKLTVYVEQVLTRDSKFFQSF